MTNCISKKGITGQTVLKIPLQPYTFLLMILLREELCGNFRKTR